MSSFEGKSVIVTGAARGIGLATARRFGAEGARVTVADIDAEHAASAADQVKQAGAPEALGLTCDVSDQEQVDRCIDATLDRFGRWDVIVNNAGRMITRPLADLTRRDWQDVLSVDLFGPFFFTRAAFTKMQRGGAIVNVSSIHAIETTPLVAAYAAAKTALLSLTRSAALEAQEKGIRVNAVLPGAVDTPMLWNNPNVKSGLEQIDRSTVGKPEDIAAVITFLASDAAALLQGAAVIADGGRLNRL